MATTSIWKKLEMKVPPLLWGGLTALGMRWTARQCPGLEISLVHPWLWGALFAFAGAGVAFSGVSQFRRHQTTVNPLSGERVTSLVTDGVYRYSRNPMYLGMLLILVGWATLLANWAAFAYLPLFVKLLTELQIKPEERLLKEKFGQEYLEFLSSSARWIGF